MIEPSDNKKGSITMSSTDLSLYDVSIPIIQTRLKAAKILLQKAQEYSEEKGFELEVLFQSRLAPDMYPLMRQFQIVTDFAKSCPARLTGQEPPSWEDTESTLDEILARIERAETILKGCNTDEINQNIDRSISLKLPMGEIKLDGKNYVLGFVLPNIFFHLSTAHAILRHNGVPVGKLDFMGMSA